MNKPTIFLSHITEEKNIAISLKEYIEKKFLKTINVFASSHEESIQLGQDWFNSIKNSIQNCNLLIILCSPISITRPWINFEAGAGWVRNIPVVPLCYSGLTPGKLPVPLNSLQGGMLNNKDDLKKLFNLIAQMFNMSSPELIDMDFISFVQDFENVAENTKLSKDINFIQNLLIRQIYMLKYSIYSSTLDYDNFEKIDIIKNDISEYIFNFNSIYNIFNSSLLMMHINKKIYTIFFDSIYDIVKNIKFIMIYNQVTIPNSIKELFNAMIFMQVKSKEWYDGIKMENSSKEYKECCIEMIKSEPLPPTKKKSNSINYLIDYFENLQFIHNWIIKYEREVNNILSHK